MYASSSAVSGRAGLGVHAPSGPNGTPFSPGCHPLSSVAAEPARRATAPALFSQAAAEAGRGAAGEIRRFIELAAATSWHESANDAGRLVAAGSDAEIAADAKAREAAKAAKKSAPRTRPTKTAANSDQGSLF